MTSQSDSALTLLKSGLSRRHVRKITGLSRSTIAEIDRKTSAAPMNDHEQRMANWKRAKEGARKTLNGEI